jgi:hypothetical protein
MRLTKVLSIGTTSLISKGSNVHFRTLLIVTTLVAVGLGLIAWLW